VIGVGDHARRSKTVIVLDRDDHRARARTLRLLLKMMSHMTERLASMTRVGHGWYQLDRRPHQRRDVSEAKVGGKTI